MDEADGSCQFSSPTSSHLKLDKNHFELDVYESGYRVKTPTGQPKPIDSQCESTTVVPEVSIDRSRNVEAGVPDVSRHRSRSVVARSCCIDCLLWMELTIGPSTSQAAEIESPFHGLAGLLLQ